MRTVTKKDITKRTAKSLGEKLTTAEMVVDTVFTALRDIMIDTRSELRIEIRDFGIFEIKNTNPKPHARNPKTGEIIQVPARKKIHFKPGKTLKNVLKEPILK